MHWTNHKENDYKGSLKNGWKLGKPFKHLVPAIGLHSTSMCVAPVYHTAQVCVAPVYHTALVCVLPRFIA